MKPSEARTLYEELNNDTVSWVDCAFWFVLGAIFASAIWVVARYA